jgi:hypothetical protein
MPSDGTENHYFGISVAVDGDTLVIGADGDDSNNGNNSGSAYVYIRLWDGWIEQTKLTASDGAMSDYFGNSVAISRDTIVVGAWNGDSANDSITGKAYVYTRSGDLWTEQTILTASDGAAGDYFGVSVAIDRDTIVVGAQRHDTVGGGGGGGGTNSGSAFVYARSSEAGVWTEQTIVTASDGAAGDYFGVSVAIDQDTIVVGADHADSTASGDVDSGSAYVYTRSSSSSSSASSPGGISWTEQAKLTASDAATGAYFGDSVAIEGDVIVIGADQLDAETESRASRSGRAYVYTRAEDLWTEQTILTASDGAPYDGFGENVAVSGGSIVVGADETNRKRGSAYIF